jgi:DNA-binding transcriptional MerR regulator
MAEPSELPSIRRPVKSPAAFRTISEVAEELDVPQHVLRFWESKFPQVKPLKRGGGRRYYRPEDVVLLRRIRQCLYQEGYTIKGVQRLLREGALRSPTPVPVQGQGQGQGSLPILPAANDIDGDDDESDLPPDSGESEREGEMLAALEELRDELLELRELLRRHRRR